MSQAFFIAGTDTEIGKTTIATALLRRARHQGYSTAACKPVASDCQATPEGLRNADALSLQAECSLPLSYAQVNPWAFAPAIAPHLAAREQGLELHPEALIQAVRPILALGADLTLIEGAGGWRVPLNAQQYLSDVAIGLGIPVILVVGVRLGCISHACLTAEAILRDGLSLAGWVANVIDSKVARLPEVLDSLQQHLPAPCLGQVPYMPSVDLGVMAQQLILPR
ncbi:dethiobiotin synthetase [Azomonas agilis]|uniref:ATP-dependent dethiobiotin synthetase BioD n=1 Tax=Azomonas agilis TaxID=116849 RepID=A0A562I009_9GAMM|nr:dethiobiotin synthase [Azomonas agilis]TWH64282.1 dethiobiotin synthetase [Azomonas agilis]